MLDTEISKTFSPKGLYYGKKIKTAIFLSPKAKKGFSDRKTCKAMLREKYFILL